MSPPHHISLRLFRYDPSSDAVPRYESYSVPYTRSMRVLDALNYVYDKLGVGFAYRWYCGVKKCGECGLTVNGTAMLSCWEPAVAEMTCEPLTNFPIIRDLAVDASGYERVIMELVPFVQRHDIPRFPEQLPHAGMNAAHRLSCCIECNVCTAEMPVKGLTETGIDWEGHAGPAAMVKFARFLLDPRDEADRMALALRAGVRGFEPVPGLKGICPQDIDITRDALVPSKRKLFGDESVREDDAPLARIFVMTPRWSAFVMLTEELRDRLARQSQLTPAAIPGLEHAYRFQGDVASSSTKGVNHPMA